MDNYCITDGHGYWVGRRRVDGRKLEFWSPKKRDAAKFHFREVAERISRDLPMRVSIMVIADRQSTGGSK